MIKEPKALEPIIDRVYSYDSNNRLVSSKINDKLTEYKYDSLGNLVQETVDGEATIYKHNILNQLLSKSGKDGEFSYTYDKRGNTLSETKDGALTKVYEFDATNRLIGGSNELGEESIYTYNALGKRIKTEQTIKNPSIAHADNLNSLPRILSNLEENAEIEAQTNPSVLNKISLTAVRNLKGYVDDQSLAVQNESPTVITDYVVDYDNIFGSPLMTFEQGSYETKYVYGNDHKKVYQNVKESKAIEDNLEDLEDVKLEKTKAPYVKIATELVGTSYFHHNAVGTTTYITLDDGSIIAKPILDEWGKISSGTVFDQNFAGLDDVNNYTGHRYDNILESYYAQARMYNPNDRRFIAEDTVQDGLNWYGYVDGNPVNKIDPSGNAAMVAITYFALVVGSLLILMAVFATIAVTNLQSILVSGTRYYKINDMSIIPPNKSQIIGQAVWNGAGYVFSPYINNAKYVVGKVWDGTKWVAGKAIDGVIWVAEKTADGFKWVAKKAADGVNAIGNAVTGIFTSPSDNCTEGSGVLTAGAISKAVTDLAKNQKDHVLQDKHNWNKLVPDPKDPKNWDKIAAIITSVLANGNRQLYKDGPAYIKSLNISGQIVEVVYNIVDGVIKIGNAWVK